MRLRTGVVALIGCLFTAGCGTAPEHSEPSVAATPARIAAIATATPAPLVLDPSDIADSFQLQAEDLVPLVAHPPTGGGDGWTEVLDQAIDASSMTPGCAGRGLYTGGWERAYEYNMVPSGASDGGVDVRTYVLPTAADAAAQQTDVGTADYANCYLVEVRNGITAQGLPLTGSSIIRLEAVSIGVPAVARLYSTPYNYNGAKTQYDLVVWMQYRTLRTIFDISTCCGVITVASVAPELRAISVEMQQAASDVSTG